jgi:uncharacterized membrane protein
MQKLALRLSWGIMTILALFLFGITFHYFSFRSDVNFLLEKQDVVHHPIWRTAFYLHIAGGMLSLAIGPFQFLRGFRNRFLKAHRALGKTYAAAILFVGAPTGLYMAFYAEGGLPSSIGFSCMSLAWLFVTWRAVDSARKRDIAAHRLWMVRSYALTFAAVTLRIYVPLMSELALLSAQAVIISSAWVSWLFNLAVAEALLRLLPRKIATP